MRVNNKKAVFVCQITDSLLKVIKCLRGGDNKTEFVAAGFETISPDIDDQLLVKKIGKIFTKLLFNNDSVVISLPSSNITCRYLKVPAQKPEEIERIISLQASRYLPYPSNELITGYQAISTDQEGYAYINLILLHQDVIRRYLKIFRQLKSRQITITLSPYGLCKLYDYVKPQDTGIVTVIDISSNQAELAITSCKKLLFSRFIKINRAQADWENLFIEEINKTEDAYVKESAKEASDKIILLGAKNLSQQFAEKLNKSTALPVEVLPYGKESNLSGEALKDISDCDDSFASLIGLGLEDIPHSLNLIPNNIKEADKNISQRKKYLRIILFVFGIIFMGGLGMIKNLDNKAAYLKKLKIELNKIEKEAKPLEQIEERFKLFEKRLQNKSSSLEMFYELHQAMPPQIYLLTFSYEDSQVVLRGLAPELNAVFKFAGQLEKAQAFGGFNIKVKYATKKQIQAGEIVDFEIIGVKSQ